MRIVYLTIFNLIGCLKLYESYWSVFVLNLYLSLVLFTVDALPFELFKYLNYIYKS